MWVTPPNESVKYKQVLPLSLYLADTWHLHPLGRPFEGVL
jgi:hypothetical protein